ncbi:MAG TPA: hypothetical protein VN155_16825 [Devosia sp.]|nr:hypothetical protein [Devosia sp.]
MADKFAALNAGSFLEFSMNKSPKCPHCGSDFDISDNEAWSLYDDNEPHEVTCPSCDQDFNVHSHADWRFSTDEQDEP